MVYSNGFIEALFLFELTNLLLITFNLQLTSTFDVKLKKKKVMI